MNNTLLIIEDNEQNLYLMRFLLEKSGFAVIGAESGPEGIKMALQPEACGHPAGHPIAGNGRICRRRGTEKT